MKWKKEFDKKYTYTSPYENGRFIDSSLDVKEIKSFISKVIKQQRETILPKLRHIRASIPLTGGMTARRMAKQLIEELENE